MLEEGFANFLESEENKSLRKQLAALREDVQRMCQEIGPLELPASREAVRLRNLQTLLIHLKEQNRKAKIMLTQVSGQTRIARSVQVSVLKDTDIKIELFNNFTAEYE